MKLKGDEERCFGFSVNWPPSECDLLLSFLLKVYRMNGHYRVRLLKHALPLKPSYKGEGDLRLIGKFDLETANTPEEAESFARGQLEKEARGVFYRHYSVEPTNREITGRVR